MSSPELNSAQPEWESAAYEQAVCRLGLLYGIRGLEIITRPGEGWSCAKHERGLTITIDPQQVIEGAAGTTSASESTPASPEITATFIAAHELGHAADFLDPDWNWHPSIKPTRAHDFFNCLIDDTVIDKRNRRVPLLDTHADAIYSHQMPADLTELPLHVQLMYGLRISTVVNDPDITISEEVATLIDNLRAYSSNGRIFDIMHALADPRTSLKERRDIADRLIWPHFNRLLDRDKQGQNGQDDRTHEQDKFEAIYDQYLQAVHGHASPRESQTNEARQAATTLQERSSDNSTLDELSAEIAQIIGQDRDSQAAKVKTSRPANMPSQPPLNQEHFTRAIKTVASELQLSYDDAGRYARSLEQLKPVIQEVAGVFMQLARPADIVMSPHYRRNATIEGLRLHPGTMAKIALQLASGQDQAVLQAVERRAKRQELRFSGIDVHLLVDVSMSMTGKKAQSAADTALCLLEGLQLARYRVAHDAGQFYQPDVRTQIIAFGAGSTVLAPLSHQPTGEQRGNTYASLLRPSSSRTYVASALAEVHQTAMANRRRNTIAIIISDGQFFDEGHAAHTLASMPSSAYVSHLIISNDASPRSICEHKAAVQDSRMLPMELYNILQGHIRKNQI